MNKNMYYVLLAADSEGNIGQIGNIVKAYMPRYGPRQKSLQNLIPPMLQATSGWSCQGQLAPQGGSL